MAIRRPWKEHYNVQDQRQRSPLSLIGWGFAKGWQRFPKVRMKRVSHTTIGAPPSRGGCELNSRPIDENELRYRGQ